MKNVVGKPVQGVNFFGRETEVEDLRRISEDEHVLMLAPRRVGKTSLLLELQRSLDDCTPVYASVAAACDERQFVRIVLQAIHATRRGKRLRPGRLTAWWRRRGTKIKGASLLGSGVELEHVDPGWQEEARTAFLPLLDSDRPWLLMLDELPTLVLGLARRDPSGERVRAFLQWLRDLRQQPGAAGALRFIHAGSIGLDSVTRRYQLSDTINDLRDWRLGPYSAETADRFLAALARSYRMNLTAVLRDRICEQAEWLIPYHLQVIFSALRDEVRGRLPTEDALDAAIAGLLGRKTYFSYWDERLGMALGAPDDDHARRILQVCATDPRGAVAATLQRALAAVIADGAQRARTQTWLLDVLHNDGYLVLADKRWRFRSGLLRRYWRSHVR